MKHLWKRLAAGLLAVVMLTGTLPPTALAVLVENTRDQNEAILRELTEFWGDEKTAQEAMELLRRYNLVDGDGSILTDWSGTVTIEEEARPLAFSEAMALTGGTVTVNGRACGASELSAVLRQMEALGLLADGVPAADWQLEVTDEAETPEELETPPAVKVLGREADPAALLEVQTFLDGYGLLTETGCLTDWGLALPGGSRPSNVTELLALLEDPAADRDMAVTVDGTPITLGDFETMMEIEAEVRRIKDTYLQESVDLTPEQASNLYSLYEQLSKNGIMLYDTRGADDLVFPSGEDHAQRVSVTPTVTVQNGGTGTITLSLAHAAKSPVTLSWRIAEGSAAGTIGGQTSGTVTFAAGEQSKTLTVQATNSDERWNGNRVFVVEFFNVEGALFANEAQAANTVVTVSQKYTYAQVDYAKEFFKLIPGVLDDWKDNRWKPITNGVITFQNVDSPPKVNFVDSWGIDFQGEPALRINSNLIDASPAGEGFQYWFHAPNEQPGFTLSREIWIKYPVDMLPLIEDGIFTEMGFDREAVFFFTGGAKRVRHKMTINGSVVLEHTQTTREESAAVKLAPLDRSKDYFSYTHEWKVEEQGVNNNRFNSNRPYFSDTKAPTVESLSVPQGTYHCGQIIPVTVRFSEPVYGADLKLTANGKTLNAVDTGSGSFGYRQTFLYTVPESGDTQLRVSGIGGMKDLSGKTATHTPTGGNIQVLPEDSMKIPALLSAVNTTPTVNAGQVTYTPAQGDQPEKTAATVTVALDMPRDTNLRNLIGGSYALDNGGFASNVLAASIDGGETLVPLVFDNGTNPTKMTATVEVDAAKLMKQQKFVMEFYTIDGTTHENTGLFFGRYAAFSVNKPVPLMASHLSITKPSGWPTEPVYVNNPPEAAALTLQKVVNAPANATWTQTRWVSSDENIATIDANGEVHPLGAGTVTFYLEAVNGNLEEYAGQRSQGVSLTFQQGAEPYLRVPEREMTIRSGDPATLRWASNLVQKNIEYGGETTATAFTITVAGPDGQQAGQYTVTYDPSDYAAVFPGTDTPMWVQGADENGAETWSPNQSFPIPGLTDTDARGYTVKISAAAHGAVPGARSFEAEARVAVVSQPVTVRLSRPGNLAQVNRGSLSVSYTLENYDSRNNAQFELVVTNNATGDKVTTISMPDSDTGGSFTIDLAGARITDGFRTIYDVSLQAKNTAEPDWSRDSFTLYIYEHDCLDILVQPVTRNGKTTVGVDGDSVKMSNEEWIASLSRDQILALNRDISLQAAISINYGDHAWGEASDRIKWASENSGIAAVNYPQGSYYENIESLPYPSYAPATQFLLSGKNSGTTAVEAIHALAGDALSSSVSITVETLKDKLYLFQFYPVGEVTLTYTNGKGKPKTAASDAQGRAAVYEASGIASDVYVSGTINNDVYLGTVYRSRLVSQEKDAVSLELYPLNTLTLRKAATLPVYLLDEKGEPYTGDVAIRAGVYRNGTLCTDAKYTTTAGHTADTDGGGENTVSFQGGKATFYYDLTQFNTNEGANPVTAADRIQFVLELRAGKDAYYPVLFTANGTTNEEETVRLAERIINLEAVPEGQANQPFVARQAVYFSGKESGPATDVRGKNGKLGPGGDYPDLLLSTTVLWWGADRDQMDGKQTIRYVDSTGAALRDQAVDSVSYPFCSMPVSHSTVRINKAQLQHLGMKDLTVRGVTLDYLGGDGTAVKQEAMRWQLMNALSLDKAGESNSLLKSMSALKDIMMNDGGMGDVGSDFLTVGLSLATTAKIESDFLTMRLSPTQDPTVFRGLVWVGLGADGDGVHGSGGYEGNLLETMGEDEDSYELNYMPGLDDVKDMISSGLAAYGQTQKNMAASAKNLLVNNVKQGGLSSVGGGGTSMEFSLSGYFETEVYYDFGARQWKMQLVTGGFQAGGGVGYEWSSNFQVGPVPMFLELGVGISAAVEFNAAVNNVDRLNDYLTQLQVKAYLKAFGGFGFDYAIVAFKLGIFGELSLDAQLRWLDAARQSTRFGYKVTLAGEVGVKVEVALLFISYSKVLWSQGFEADLGISRNWNSIEDYWKEVGAGKSGAGGLIVPEGASLLAYDAASGRALLSADQETTLVDRDYLGQYRRSYNSAGPGAGVSLLSLFTGSAGTSAVKTIDNAYSYASPAITDDGRWLFYLDDMGDSTDATVVRVSAAERTGGGGYSVAGRAALDDQGYGDSGLSVSGKGEQPVAVWSRVTQQPAVTEPGQAVTPDVQAAMLNSSDIMAAVRSGSGWTVTNLTENNGAADLAPVAAASGSNILVAWRQVASSDAADLTNFNARDYIYYRYSSDYGKNWTDAQPIYNGTSGAVKGLEAAMLPDGTAAVAFTLQTGEHGGAGYSQEIAYAIVGKDEESSEYQVRRYVQMTDDDNLDENPQLAAVKLDDTTEAFVLGWHSLSPDGSSDIRLAAVNKDGNRVTGFVDSLGSLVRNTGVSVSANFQFVQNAASLDQLSVLWRETADAGDAVSHDYLSALRFRAVNEQGTSRVSVTSAQRLVEMEKCTGIDSFNAYVDEGSGSIYAVLQGTHYDYTKTETFSVGGTSVQVAGDKTIVYTAVGGYTDTLRVDSVVPDYPNIKIGMSIPVQVGVTNLGTRPMEEVRVTIGGDTTTFSAGAQKGGFVAIAPGESRTLTVFHTVAADSGGQIVNPKYTVGGKIGGSEVPQAKDTLILNIPDLGIARSDILVDAGDGLRTLQFTLYNASDARLAGSGRSVCFQIYSDPECTQPIDSRYFEEVAAYAEGREALKTISGGDLAGIDEGVYTMRYRFDLDNYIQQTGADSSRPFADGDGEVRDGGVSLYAKAWVQLDGGELLEFNSGNNVASVTVESLLKQADGAPTTVTSTLDNSGDTTGVTVDVRYNKLTGTASGNLIVTLLDEGGRPLEKLQSYTQQNGLLNLSKEETATKEFTFSQKGASVKVEFSDLILDENSVELNHISLTGTDMAYDPDTGTYTATGTGLTSGILNIAPKDPVNAKITCNGEDYGVNEIHDITLPYGTTEWKIVVTNGGNEAEYTLILNNTNPSVPQQPTDPGSSGSGSGGGSGGAGTYPVKVEAPEHGRVTASTAGAKSGSTVTLTVTPDSGYVLDTLTVTDSRGNEIKLAARGGGRYTFTMPGRAVTVKAAFALLPEDTEQPCDGGENCPSRGFTDLGGVGTWYHEAVDYVLRNNLMGGYGDGLFGPDNRLTRAHLAQILYNREGRPAAAGGSPFTDVANGAWYSDAITWASANGIVGGYGDGRFGPNDNITREQLATILWRRSGSPAATNKELHFTDADEIGGYALEAIRWAVERGILSGYGDGRLRPKGQATRAQAAKMLKSFLESRKAD